MRTLLSAFRWHGPYAGLPGRLGKSEAASVCICGGSILIDRQRVGQLLRDLLLHPQTGRGRSDLDPASHPDTEDRTADGCYRDTITDAKTEGIQRRGRASFTRKATSFLKTEKKFTTSAFFLFLFLLLFRGSCLKND